MWSDISTPAAVTSNQESFDDITYRLVLREAAVATQRVTDSKEEFDLIENLVAISASKFGDATGVLHPLLAKPFTTKNHRGGSRFGAESSGGIFYSALSLETSAAERGFYVQKLLRDSPNLKNISQPHTEINVHIRTQIVDVRVAPFNQATHVFEDKNSYSKTQEFGEVVRQTNVLGVKYKSVRLKNGSPCLALFSPDGFAKKTPAKVDSQWSCYATENLVRWTNPYAFENGSSLSFEFSYE